MQRTDVMNKVENFRNKSFFIAHGTADGITIHVYCSVAQTWPMVYNSLHYRTNRHTATQTVN